MKLEDAMRIILKKRNGFRVRYENADEKFVTYACFPDHSCRPPEPPIDEESRAWLLAESFAAKSPTRYRNITVVSDEDFKPIDPFRVFRRA